MTATLTSRDKVRRTAYVAIAIAGVVGIVLALNWTVDIDNNGDTVTAREDISGVVESGDADAIANAPLAPDGTGPTQADLVEQLIPSEGSEQLSQVQIGIDLTNGLDANLTVNGVPIPPDELQRRPELNQVFFRPGPDRAVEALEPGDNVVRADIFDPVDPTTIVRVVEWHFEVT
jgi:hypothetical protein